MGTDRLVRRRSDAIAAIAGFAVLFACGLIARSGTVGAAERSVFEAINGLPDGLEPVMHQAQFLGVLAIGPLVALIALALRRQAVPAEGERDQGHEGADRQDPEELRLMHHRLEAVGQPVDGLEDRAFRGAHGAAPGDEPARDQHGEARDGGDRVRATPD